MKCHYACRSPEHMFERRKFLGGLAGGVGAATTLNFSGLLDAAMPELDAAQKHILIIWLAGGLSQLESWDPKPKTDTGGPFRAIPTSVPGTHICELLPYTARQMHHLALVRSINTKENDHGKGHYCMTTGRRQEAVGEFPHLGAVGAKLLAPERSPLPGHIHIATGGGGGTSNNAAFLGPKYASIMLGNGAPPQNTARPAGVSESADKQRNAFRMQANDHFARRRRTAESDAFTSSYDQALQLMERRDVFDVAKEPPADMERYGTHEFGRHCLLARRLLEQGVSCVQVHHSNYDTHNENFDFHIEQLGEFDRTFATLVEDLVERGLWKNTLLVVMSEFGRTPQINKYFGRDHWGTAWSVVLGGCGIQSGALIGKTNANGTEVTDRQVDHGHLFHTYLRAVGVDSTAKFDAGGRGIPMADPAAEPIQELLT
ncbi:MAG: DUF1501 domain-containing protein [Planctomycetia bacterium]|nr:DUF1501 domain-containing protein [Planctomycetia bacterium]